MNKLEGREVAKQLREYIISQDEDSLADSISKLSLEDIILLFEATALSIDILKDKKAKKISSLQKKMSALKKKI